MILSIGFSVMNELDRGLTTADPRRTNGVSQAYTLEVTKRAKTDKSFMVAKDY